ncbi:glycoside hydrolase family 16 protein [Bacillus sp. FSL K6-3431]|uniref:glycoside hydrolase family 16 protein n=1 Tax=Bacillus sp. FSL K6-3431 TaxID=2921500 RepID=UPI0030FB4BF4
MEGCNELETIKQIEVVDREIGMPVSQSLKIPFSGCTRRRFTANAVINNHTKRKIDDVIWSLSAKVNGITIDQEGLLVITPEANMATFKVVARYKDNMIIRGETEVQVIKTSGRDIPPNPLERDGWKLYFHDEFDTGMLDRSVWADQYIRNWSDDIRSKTNYFFEDGAIVIKADTDSQSWSPFDPNENSSITSFEKTYLHRFGSNVNESSRIIPEYDGLATKYGYFEIRAKLPDTGDGSHVAWWMIGVQDDQNINPHVEDPTVVDKRSSNETGEVDIIEIGLDELTSWRPVMHPNDSTSLEYLYVPETIFHFDPGNEFHIYGFEWDEKGTKYYIDNQLAQVTDRTFDYRMMTFLGLYPQGGMGKANKIFPKEFAIDYVRIYKKDEPIKANDIMFDKNNRPYSVEKPTNTTSKNFRLTATVLDQFDKPMQDIPLEWQFSESISGGNAKSIPGASIDRETGEISMTNQISEKTDLFITAKVKSDLKVKKVFHMKVSSATSKPLFIHFMRHKKLMELKIPKGAEISEIMFEARLIDQYGKQVNGELSWQLAEGTTIRDSTNINGISIDPDKGILTLTSSARGGTHFFVQVKSAYQSKETNKYKLDNTIYGHQLIKLVHAT